MTFSTLLVANRGEIALRIIRAARARDLRTVAVYSDADRHSPHVRAADAAVRLGPAPASQSYLRIDALLDAAARTGADAVHPGYGFLSERADLARAVAGAGLVWVGPSADVIDLMGRKDVAREVAVAAGVPVVPDVQEDERADPAHFPLLVKARAGGGGKGMRIVRSPSELPSALAAAEREAVNAFGDGALLVERYLEQGRHVEVQVLADHHGHVLHLFERDCSVQRRHQKVVEESPAPTISPDLRARLTEWAVALAKQVGYTNAGTVEFIVAGSPGPEEAFFLEMNTRLQVEHPVTELVTGLDLVDLQLRIAAGEVLPIGQDDVRTAGHAIEARIYAEDPAAGFLPQSGTAEVVRWSPRARVDTALEQGQEVGTDYDPMLGKVIVHGATREAARRAMVDALDDSALIGLTTNLGFVRDLVASDDFAGARIHTAWLDGRAGAMPAPDPWPAAVVAAWVLATGPARPPAEGGPPDVGPFAVADGWRLGGPPAPVAVELAVDGAAIMFHVERSGRVTGGDRAWEVHPLAAEAGTVRLEIDGLVHEAAVLAGPHGVDVAHRGHTLRFPRPDAFGPGTGPEAAGGSVVSPMPGTVVAVAVAAGDRVQAGQLLGVVEAMKMELPVTAPVSGTVTSIAVGAGDRVALGAELFVVDEG